MGAVRISAEAFALGVGVAGGVGADVSTCPAVFGGETPRAVFAPDVGFGEPAAGTDGVVSEGSGASTALTSAELPSNATSSR